MGCTTRITFGYPSNQQYRILHGYTRTRIRWCLLIKRSSSPLPSKCQPRHDHQTARALKTKTSFRSLFPVNSWYIFAIGADLLKIPRRISLHYYLPAAYPICLSLSKPTIGRCLRNLVRFMCSWPSKPYLRTCLVYFRSFAGSFDLFAVSPLSGWTFDANTPAGKLQPRVGPFCCCCLRLGEALYLSVTRSWVDRLIHVLL